MLKSLSYDIIKTMKELFLENGIDITNEQYEKFEKYYQLLVFYNEKFNITAITEKREVFIKHFLDSVINLKKLTSGKLIDVGSGGGFPVIPIKIINRDLQVVMLEATGKKCQFLNEVIKELNLTNAQVINNRAEILAKNELYREQFDYCTARAVARLNTLSEYCLPFVKVGGEFIAHKGDSKEEVLEAKKAFEILGAKLENLQEFELFGAKRSIITIKKIKNTPLKYPRGNGKERKNPL